MKPGPGLPSIVASGSLNFPNRPRGFFLVDGAAYTTGTLDYVLYSMTVRGNTVVLSRAGALGNQSMPTRDTAMFGGLLYAYQTGSKADFGWMAAHVFVYNHLFRMRTMVSLPGPALPSDASQHSLFVFNGELYFVTQSAVGYMVPPPTVNVNAAGGTDQSGAPSSNQQGSRALASEGVSFMTSVGFLGPMFWMTTRLRSRSAVAEDLTNQGWTTSERSMGVVRAQPQLLITR